MKKTDAVPLDELQQYIARISIGASTVRLGGRKHKGLQLTGPARQYLSELPLKKLIDVARYPERIDRWTAELQLRFPHRGQYWGIARKCVNIFMRNVAYNHWLRRAYSLDKLDAVLEVPLDSYARKGLRREEGGQRLRECASVIGVTPEINAEYQAFAANVARRRGINRVHLDLWYFTERD